jgi:hypothetical protein
MRGQLRTNAYLRLIENRWGVEVPWWDACIDESAGPILADKTLAVWVGVDASVKRDSTAVVAVTWDDEQRKVRLVAHRIFQPSSTEPLDFEETIEATVLALMQHCLVRQVRFDPFQMQSVSQRLCKQQVPMVEFAQSVPNKKDPSKSVAQHFSKIYSSSEELHRQDISERNISKAGYPPVADTTPVECEGDGYKELCAMTEEFRQNNPFISFAEAFERVGEANPELMQRERKERYERMGTNV